MPLSQPQEQIATDEHRFITVVAGRRFGKTHLSIRQLCRHARIPDSTVWYVAPTYRQAKQIVWRKLKNKLTDLRWTKRINESELSIELKNGSIISLKGADNADSLRGVGLDYLVMDEFADIDPEAWYEVLRPTLADREGGALFIGTPKGLGNWAHDLFNMPTEQPEQWASYQFTTIQGGNVKPEEIEAARRDLDERTFRQEFMATFETYAGRIYYSFERAHNVVEVTELDLGVIYIGIDFNIDPMSAVIATRKGDTLYVFDEIRMFSSNTQELVAEISARYPKSRVWAYPDPASRQRKTSAGGVTDLTILQNANYVVKCPTSHTPVRDRINAVNSRLKDSTGVRHLFISPKCKYTIEGLERQTYKEGTVQPDKESGYDHQMDALGYLVDYMFPIRKDAPAYVPQRWGHRLA
jgi:hypothetical protein